MTPPQSPPTTAIEILDKMHEDLAIGWVRNDGKPHTIKNHASNDNCTTQALAELKSLMMGCVPTIMGEDGVPYYDEPTQSILAEIHTALKAIFKQEV